jgi:hypothetical protein
VSLPPAGGSTLQGSQGLQVYSAGVLQGYPAGVLQGYPAEFLQGNYPAGVVMMQGYEGSYVQPVSSRVGDKDMEVISRTMHNATSLPVRLHVSLWLYIYIYIYIYIYVCMYVCMYVFM